MNDWKKYKLGEVVSWGNGKERPKDKGPIPVYGGNGVLDYTNRNNYEGETVIVGRVGAYCGSVYYTNQSIWVSDNALAAKPKNGNDTKFLYYLLQHLNLNGYAEGSTHPLVTQRLLNSIDVVIPPIVEQRRIAGVLSSLDDKIDLLNRENATLEALAETFFRHYFIEPPNPNWKEGTIADLVDFNPLRKLVKGEDAPYVEMANIGTRGYAPSSWRLRPFSSGTKFSNGDALFARISPCLENGKAAYIDFLSNEQVGWGSTEFIVMHSRMGLHPFFAYLLTRYDDFRDHAVSSLVGSSGRQRVDLDNLVKYPMTIPDKKTIMDFNREMEVIVPKMRNNQQQILTLSSQRDTLLPRLMSGEVRANGQ